jgi:hypothetical protein
MSVSATLPDHVVFRELPFCGVLLDTRSSRVYRLTQQATAVLREALPGPRMRGPYEPVIGVPPPPPTAEARRSLLAKLGAQGLVRVADAGTGGEPKRDDGT